MNRGLMNVDEEEGLMKVGEEYGIDEVERGIWDW